MHTDKIDSDHFPEIRVSLRRLLLMLTGCSIGFACIGISETIRPIPGWNAILAPTALNVLGIAVLGAVFVDLVGLISGRFGGFEGERGSVLLLLLVYTNMTLACRHLGNSYWSQFGFELPLPTEWAIAPLCLPLVVVLLLQVLVVVREFTALSVESRLRWYGTVSRIATYSVCCQVLATLLPFVCVSANV